MKKVATARLQSHPGHEHPRREAPHRGDPDVRAACRRHQIAHGGPGKSRRFQLAAAAQMSGAQPDGEHLQFMRDNWLANRVFTSYENLLDPATQAGPGLCDNASGTGFKEALEQIAR
jgi:hypothetical protein